MVEGNVQVVQESLKTWKMLYFYTYTYIMYAHMDIIKIKYLHIFKEKNVHENDKHQLQKSGDDPWGLGEREQNGGRGVHGGVYLSM